MRSAWHIPGKGSWVGGVMAQPVKHLPWEGRAPGHVEWTLGWRPHIRPRLAPAQPPGHSYRTPGQTPESPFPVVAKPGGKSGSQGGDREGRLWRVETSVRAFVGQNRYKSPSSTRVGCWYSQVTGSPLSPSQHLPLSQPHHNSASQLSLSGVSR